jgi:protein SCO1
MSQSPKKFSMRKMATVVLIVGAMISIALQLVNRLPSSALPEELAGVVLPEPRQLAPFTLTDHNGQPFDLTRLQGRWTFFFFGYTHCPDICPTALGELAEVFENLQQDKKILSNSQAVFVTVDPERDGLKSLKDYVPYFNSEFIGVTGTVEQINKFAKQLGAVYMVSPERDEQGGYQVSHTSAFFLINPKAEFYALFQSELTNPEKTTKSYLKIRQLN